MKNLKKPKKTYKNKGLNILKSLNNMTNKLQQLKKQI